MICSQGTELPAITCLKPQRATYSCWSTFRRLPLFWYSSTALAQARNSHSGIWIFHKLGKFWICVFVSSNGDAKWFYRGLPLNPWHPPVFWLWIPKGCQQEVMQPWFKGHKQVFTAFLCLWTKSWAFNRETLILIEKLKWDHLFEEIGHCASLVHSDEVGSTVALWREGAGFGILETILPKIVCFGGLARAVFFVCGAHHQRQSIH